MKIKTVKNIFNKSPKSKFDNNWATSHYMFNHPQLHAIVAPRGTGKTHLMSKIVLSGIKENLYDRIFLISPTAQSNLKQLQDLNIQEEDIFLPDVNAIQNVINEVEAERDEYQKYLDEMKIYQSILNNKNNDFTDEDFELIEDMMFEDKLVAPKYKRKNPRRPQCIVILDDILNTPVMSQGSSFNRLMTINRHIAPMRDGGACGLGLIILAQTYSTTNGHGLSRALRENLTELTIFKNKQEGQLTKMVSEFGGAIDEETFRQAYDIAIREEFDNLTISFGRLACETLRFRRNLNQFIIFPEAEKKCMCKKN
tara:strand:- start:5646 stop:6578 length:933 start_codon:yes stop_codon:yes gene_type:complete